MSAGEVAWRAVGRLRDAELWGRLALRLEPRPRASDPGDAGACADPGFRVCDLRVGEWAVPERDEERQWRDRLVAHAEQVARHRLSFFDLVDRHLGDPIDWNRDHGSGRKAPLRFAPLVDYRDYDVTGDAKVVWEPNRHHHLVVLGRAYRATGDVRFAAVLVEQLESWLEQCPFGRGMNWRSPLELAIRLINWVWAIDLIRESGLVTGKFQNRLRHTVYLHLWEITRKYSRGSSANNHRIGEAAGVFIGLVELPRYIYWCQGRATYAWIGLLVVAVLVSRSEAKARALRPEMSKPTRSDVLNPSAPTVFSVPLFGGFWIASRSRPESMSNSVVVAAPEKLLVCAEPTTLGVMPKFTSPAP